MNRYANLVEQATSTPFRPGNDFDVLNNGAEIFPAMLDAIRGAKHTIEFVTYVYWASDIANEFADALCDRAHAGVQVRLLIDAVGGAIMNARTVWQLERAGVKVAWFRPMRWNSLIRLNNRTHRKILLVDGQLGFTGGVGIADFWTGNADDPKHWRETHCRIAGPACADLFASFAENWREATGEDMPERKLSRVAGSVAVHTTSSTAGTRPTKIESLLAAMIGAAQERLWVTSAYFVPNLELTAAMVAAVARGADVRILTNGPLSNHKVTWRAGRASYDALLQGGVRIFEYRPTVLHAKVITADESWATLGSTNLDNRSLILNDELNVSVTAPGIVAGLDRDFLADLERAREIRGSAWRRRRFTGKLAEAGANVFARQL
jgi:cardiolipin synthase A/B